MDHPQVSVHSFHPTNVPFPFPIQPPITPHPPLISHVAIILPFHHLTIHSGAWLVFPTYMIYVLGGEIIEGLTIASTGVALKSE